MKAQDINPVLGKLINELEKQEGDIPESRKETLGAFAAQLAATLSSEEVVRVTFVCTHNSRRSQLSQAWMKAAATHYGVDGIFTFSGGTESTAFNSRMVTAMERAGFMIKQLDEWDNPKYLVRLSDEDPTLDIYFSKKFDDSYNPKSGFIAVMVCSDADEACPVVPGAAARVSLPYLDPKAADNTAEEDEAYDMKVMEIGREMLYVMRQVNQ